MPLPLRILFLAAVLGASAPTVGLVKRAAAEPRGADRQEHRAAKEHRAAQSVARYATDEFVAGCYVRPKALIKHGYLGSLPFSVLAPGPLSLGRLDALGVEEVAVFCGPPATRLRGEARAQASMEWAAAARLAQPIDLPTVMKQWRTSLVLQEKDSDAKPRATRIADHDCFQIPAGSFFEPPRTYGELRFTDRSGKPAKEGINIGREYDNRGYIEGQTLGSAIFTLENLGEDALIDGHLPLELRPDVFLTARLDRDFASAQIELRSPDSGLRSEPIRFAAKSYVSHRLNVPRKIIAIDGEVRKQVDLLTDLAPKGRLEVVLKATDRHAYLGVGRRHLSVQPRAFEYAFVAGREIVVAQSADTLKKMLIGAQAPGAIAKRLSQPDTDVVIAISAHEAPRRLALQRLVRSTDDGPNAELFGKALTDMTATVNVSGRAVGRVSAEFGDRPSAETALGHFNQWIRSTKDHAQATIGDSLKRLDSSANLTALWLEGVSMMYPSWDSPAAKAREEQLLAIVNDALSGLHAKAEGTLLNVEFTEPATIGRLVDAAPMAVANIEEVIARDMFARERFDLGDEVYQRVTDRVPHVPQAWFRRAHHLAFNMSVEFDTYENRYAWISRGVHVLLDGAERNAGTKSADVREDLIWMAARFIEWKIGRSDDRQAFRRLFSEDERLLKRLAKIVDVERAKSPDKRVDNWLVAKMLFEHRVDRAEKSRMSSSIPSLQLFSRPAAAQAGYAEALNETGYSKEALSAWKEAERLYKELGDRTIPLGPSERIRLDDLAASRAKLGPGNASVKKLQAARSVVQYEYWLARSKLEQDAKLQSARRLSQEAARARQAEVKKAFDLYRQSLAALAEVHKQSPTEFSQLAGDFYDVAEGYRRLAKTLDEKQDESLDLILGVIDQSQRESSSPFLRLFELKDVLEGR